MTTNCSGSPAATEISGEAQHLADFTERQVLAKQGWGVLGIDTCAHEAGRPPMPLRVGGREYAKGLGTHAPSEIVYLLEGGYARFDAVAGLQDGQNGASVFQVFADGVKVFDSGVIDRHNRATTVSLPIPDVDELRLVTVAEGPGIAEACTNWADARVTPAVPDGAAATRPAYDVARSARVMTWDPRRKDGVRNGRLDEFPAAELYPGEELAPDARGNYAVPVPDGTGCIGLQWMERRRVRRLELKLADADSVATDTVRVEYWSNALEGVCAGSTWWQGSWAPLKGALVRDGDVLVFSPDWRKNPDAVHGTFKVRWIFDKSPAAAVALLSAFTGAPWLRSRLRIELGAGAAETTASLTVYNGAVVGADGRERRGRTDVRGGDVIDVLHSKPRICKGDRTVLRVETAAGRFGVSVDDVLTSRCVYVPHAGFFVSHEPAGITLEEYRRSIAGRRGILDEVRSLPDQSFGQAMASVHRPEADLGPTMLSLACGNAKFIVHRDGAIEYDSVPSGVPDRMPERDCLFRPRAGAEPLTSVTRRMEDAGLPIVIAEGVSGAVTFRQRTFVAPCGGREARAAGAPAWMDDKPLCVAELTAVNGGPADTEVQYRLEFISHQTSGTAARASAGAAGWEFYKDKRLIAFVPGGGPGAASAPRADGECRLALPLRAGATSSVLVLLPGWDARPSELAALADAGALAAATRDHWRRVLEGSTRIALPDSLLTDIIRASQVHCLLAARNEDGRRVAPWIASAHYGPLESEGQSVIRGMQFLGHEDFARRAHDYYIARYNKQGFLTTGYTVMGTGWHLWCLGEYDGLFRNDAWLKGNAAEVARVCAWTAAQLEKTKRHDAAGGRVPEYGLMPPGVAADWNAYAFYFYLNGYYCAGLRAAGEALGRIGAPGAGDIRRTAAGMKDDIMHSFHGTQSIAPVYPLRNGTWVPMYPSQTYGACTTEDLHPGQDVGRSFAYDVELGSHHLVPLGVMEPDSREARWMMDHMEDVQFLADGWHYYPSEKSRRDWFNLGGFAKCQPYYARNAEICAMQDDVKPFIRSYFNTIPSLLNREDLSLWEHFFNGAFNKTHETGYLLYQSRVMLLQERGRELWLAPFVTCNWLKDGMEIGVGDAPTAFGPVSYRIDSRVGQGYIDAEITVPRRTPPSAIVLRLRHPDGASPREVRVDGAVRDGEHATDIRLLPAAGATTVTVQARY